MPNYIVRVSYSYPVQAVSAEDALSTVPHVTKVRFVDCLAEGKTEILRADTKQVVLTAKLKIGGEIK